jgi:hypothetical protein
MRKILFVFMCVLSGVVTARAQQVDNYSFFKLLVTNDKNEILLVKWENDWEIIGERYNKGLSIKAFVDFMASEMGIEVSNIKLASMFTQRNVSKPNPTLMQYYTARFVKGNIRPPSDCTDIKWVSFEEAMKMIPYDIMKSVITAIKKNPGKVMGAAFETSTDPQSNKQVIKVLEDFYVMN